MTEKKVLTKIRKQVSQSMRRDKKIFAAGIVVLIVTLIFWMNLNMLQMGYYTMKQDTPNVIVLLERSLGKAARQYDWDFQRGIDYLASHLTEEGKDFLEENFLAFEPVIKEKIIETYNKEGSVFTQNQDVFQVVAVLDEVGAYGDYIKRLSSEEIEKALKAYIGESPKLTQDIVDQLYNILSQQKNKISNDLLKLDVYELISFPHNGDLESTSLKLLSYIEDEAIREGLFTRLKTEPVEIDIFSTWIDILNRKKIITTEEYALFTTGYGNLRRLQNEYAQALLQEVDLLNIKQSTDVQTEEMERQQIALSTQIEALKLELIEAQETLAPLQNYKEMDLYVLDQYQNGDYEATTPEKSWLFDTYKPGKDRIRLKITNSSVYEQGVMRFNVYNVGTSEEGLPYYVEVSASDYTTITELTNKVEEIEVAIDEKEIQVAKYIQDVEQIRKLNNYEQTLLSMQEIEESKESLLLEIKKEKVAVQNLFEIGELIVEVKE